MKIAPSILSADFAHLAAEIERMEKAGAHQLHVDVMDGHYVPNFTFGPMLVEAVRRCTQLPLDVHLMIENADRWIDTFVNAGADMIAVHPEALYHLHSTLQSIKKRGKQAGIALNPSTPLSTLDEILPYIDYIIIMSVNPGWGGQTFIEGSFDKARRVHQMVDEKGLQVVIQIDGGMTTERIPLAAKAGIDVAIAGSAIFKAPDPATTLREMIAAATLQ